VNASDGELARAIASSFAKATEDRARGSGAAQEAETELYRRFAPRVRLYGLRHLRDEESARDLVQQVMMLTIEKLRRGAVRDPDQIASFVLGTSRTMAIAVRRKDMRHELLRDKFLVAPAAHAAPEAGATLDLDRLEQCMTQLADRERSVVFLTFYAESAAASVAAEIGVSEGNVRVIRHRALAKLRACVLAGRQAS
jgi:RNA polymerase sigma-70 factor, ECF subfamily